MTFTQFLLTTLLDRAKERVLRPSWFRGPTSPEPAWTLYTRWRDIERAKLHFVYVLEVAVTNGSLRSWAMTEAATLNGLDALGRWQAILGFCNVPGYLHSHFPIDQLTLDALALYTSQADDT